MEGVSYTSPGSSPGLVSIIITVVNRSIEKENCSTRDTESEGKTRPLRPLFMKPGLLPSPTYILNSQSSLLQNWIPLSRDVHLKRQGPNVTLPPTRCTSGRSTFPTVNRDPSPSKIRFSLRTPYLHCPHRTVHWGRVWVV